MKLIEQYQRSCKVLDEQLADGKCSVKKIVEVQELKYRISSLSTLRSFGLSAPIDGTMEEINYHFRIFMKYLGFLLEERRMGKKTDESGQKKRETALDILQDVFETKRAEFEQYDFEEKPTTYAKFVNDVLGAMLPVWVQYRDTYIDVSKLPLGEEKGETTEKQEKTETDPVKEAASVQCPLSRFKGKTLGEVLREDPSAITYLAGKGADKYGASYPKVVESAKILCEYAKEKSKQAKEDVA